MKERPILFSGPMVRAILEGQKTQTRRVIKPPFEFVGHGNFLVRREGKERFCPYSCPHGKAGDRLWVREAFAKTRVDGLVYRSTFNSGTPMVPKWTPSIHMPRWACRIVLEITGIRVQQLQDIGEADALAEGIEGPFEVGYTAYRVPGDSKPRYSSASAAFKALWNSINIIRAPWDRNPWVWAIEFKRVEA